jgi:hypothetical protein
MSEEDKIILIRITLPVIVYIVILICIEFKIFRMAVVIVLAWMAVLAERMDRRWQRAKQEIE